jgi:hypothetical protein
MSSYSHTRKRRLSSSPPSHMASIIRNVKSYNAKDAKYPTYQSIQRINELIDILIRYIHEDPDDFLMKSYDVTMYLKELFMTSDFERSYATGHDEKSGRPTQCSAVTGNRYAEPFQNNLYLVFLVNIAIRIRDTDDVATLRDIASILMSLEDGALTGVMYIPNVDSVSYRDCRSMYIDALKKSSMGFYYRTVMDVYDRYFTESDVDLHQIHSTFACHTIHDKTRPPLHIPCILPSIPISNTHLRHVAMNKARLQHPPVSFKSSK